SHSIAGGQLAIVKGGKLVYAKSYGMADRSTQEPVTNRSLFRIASVSKPITALAIMKLVQDGKFTLDQPFFPILDLSIPLKPGQQIDPRFRKITIRKLLEHRGG